MTYPSNSQTEEPISREERFRRVIIVATNFMRNLAIVRAASNYPVGWKTKPLHAQVNFWRVAIGNSADACAMEYCKLFADKSGKHSWQKFVTDKDKFKRELLSHLGVSESELADYEEAVQTYRDKFVAHLDSERVMHIPNYEMAELAIVFYHRYILENEDPGYNLGELATSPERLEKGLEQEKGDVEIVFANAGLRKQ